MHKINFVIKLLIFAFLITWTIRVCFCVLFRMQHEHIVLFLIILGLVLQTFFLISTFLFLFKFQETISIIRKSDFPKLQVVFVFFPFVSWLIAINFVIVGLQGQTLDKFNDNKRRATYWEHCVFTVPWSLDTISDKTGYGE
jgi:hypothetical protein